MKGKKDSTWRDNGHPLRASARTPVGFVHVVATPMGIVDVSVGESEEALPADAHALWSEAVKDEPTGPSSRWASMVAELVSSGGVSAAPPVVWHGTPFQERVWNLLVGIRAGTVTTYGTLARELGINHGARAVAAACAANRFAIVVPCHRVIAGDGGLAGYRWGTGRKRRLLELEGAILG